MIHDPSLLMCVLGVYLNHALCFRMFYGISIKSYQQLLTYMNMAYCTGWYGKKYKIKLFNIERIENVSCTSWMLH